jgi:hypothetical protein
MNDSRLFTDSELSQPLPPIYKGKDITIWPGQLAQYPAQGNRGINGSYMLKQGRPRRSALRRYVFRYEGGKFVYLATRKGQRNGGFTSKGAGTNLNIIFNHNQGGFNSNFTFRGKNTAGEDVWSTGPLNQFRYDSANSRWVWETAPAPAAGAPMPALSATGFSSSTTNTLPNAGTINEVSWTYINNPYTTQTPQLPATLVATPIQWYNNNDIENLNKWPIKNKDMNYGVRKHMFYHRWQELDYDYIESVNFSGWDAGNGLYIRQDRNSNYFYRVVSSSYGSGMTLSQEDYLYWDNTQWCLWNQSEIQGGDCITNNNTPQMSMHNNGGQLWTDNGYGLGTASKRYAVKPEGRPDCLTDDYLNKCFAGVNLKHYDTVFVEVMWKFVSNKNYKRGVNYFDSGLWNVDSYKGILNFGIPLDQISDMDWWTPRPFRTKSNKGRVYRIGILEEDTGVGGHDKVLWCQRTKTITTKYDRGGHTALE